MTQIAELNSRVLFGLGGLPPEWINLLDIHNAVVQQHSVLLNTARVSDVNVLLSITGEFSPSDYEPYDITNLIGNGVPSFVELYSSEFGWLPIRAINVVNLPTARIQNEECCAFYGDESNGLRQYVQFSFAASESCRIRYDKDSAPFQAENYSALPTHIAEYVVLLAQNSLIPKIKLRAMANAKRSNLDLKKVQFYSSILDGLYVQNLREIEPLKRLFEVWAFRDKSSQNSAAAKRFTPAGRRLYGE